MGGEIMSVKFEFSGSWEYDGDVSDAQDFAADIRDRYGGTLDFLTFWNVADQITVTVDGEKVFGP